jgi:hypothetical protein
MRIKSPEKLLFHETLYSLSISNIVNYIRLSTGILAGIGICLIGIHEFNRVRDKFLDWGK